MTKKKIESLPPEQIARLPEFVKKWTKIGLCTEPANRQLAEEGILEAYEIVGLAPPKVVWCDSPLSMGLTRAVLQDLIKSDKLPKLLGASVGASVRDSVGDSVGDSVWAYVGDIFSPVVPAWQDGRYPFASAVNLWRQGFVPSFDGKRWRLHAGPKAAVVHEAVLSVLT